MLPRLFSDVAPKILAVARRHYNGVVEQTLLPRCHAKMYTTAFPIRIQGERPVDERCLCRACSYLVLTCFRDKHLVQDNERATAITRAPHLRRTDGGQIQFPSQRSVAASCVGRKQHAGKNAEQARFPLDAHRTWGIRKS